MSLIKIVVCSSGTSTMEYNLSIERQHAGNLGQAVEYAA